MIADDYLDLEIGYKTIEELELGYKTMEEIETNCIIIEEGPDCKTIQGPNWWMRKGDDMATSVEILPRNLVIHAPRYSAVERYAKENHIRFAPL